MSLADRKKKKKKKHEDDFFVPPVMFKAITSLQTAKLKIFLLFGVTIGSFSFLLQSPFVFYRKIKTSRFQRFDSECRTEEEEITHDDLIQ